MGIPSYYKRLIDTIPGLVSKGRADKVIQWLFMDFNCLIYHCLHREDTPQYPGEAGREEWEAEFLECIVKYCLKVIKEVDPKQGVFIAIDGVVPMAKMRQQRLRRFKSVWAAASAGSGKEGGWDRNAITPGTAFMKKLRGRLETMISKNGRKSWILSSSDEPGEGEHKIIAEWRRGEGYSGDFAVYGLDADLIVLSILGRECCGLQKKIWLFREEVAMGKMVYDDIGEEVFEWFSINALRDWLAAEAKYPTVFIMNYCFAMTVLGNDFLPSSLSLKIREDGHADLLEVINTLSNENIALVDLENYSISFNNLLRLFKELAAEEERRIQKYVHKKHMMGIRIEQDKELGQNNWPLAEIEEESLLDGKHLARGWKEKYMAYFSGFNYTKRDITKICREYLYGLQWTWSYYTGAVENVCFNWNYPFGLPPLWQWIYDYMKEIGGLPTFPDRVLVRACDIRPVEQLALVLPLESWSLIPDGIERELPRLAPHFYPSVFSFESVGKRYFWECESMIPLPSILEVKHILSAAAAGK